MVYLSDYKKLTKMKSIDCSSLKINCSFLNFKKKCILKIHLDLRTVKKNIAQTLLLLENKEMVTKLPEEKTVFNHDP